MKLSKLLVPIAGVMLLAGCRTAFDPAPPAGPVRLSNIPRIAPAPLPGVLPEIRRIPADDMPALDLSGGSDGRNLVLTAHLDIASRVALEPYSQWYITLKIDTDQHRAFAHPGADYQVNGPAEGWMLDVTDFGGQLTGRARFESRSKSFVVRVPLSALGNDDGTTSCELVLGSRNPHSPGMASYRFETRARVADRITSHE